MLEKMIAKMVEAKLEKENEVAKLLVEKHGLEDLAKKFVEDKLN